MNDLQKKSQIIEDTVKELKSLINEISEANGTGEVISDCTSFVEYPSILRSVSLNASNGIATIFAYRISDVDPGSPGIEGKFDFNNNEYAIPKNWVTANELQAKEKDTVWMTQAMFAKNAGTDNNMVSSWSKPIKISTYVEPIIQDLTQTVYLSTVNSNTPGKPFAGSGDSVLNEDSIKAGWSESYSGLTTTQPYCWISSRKRKDGIWSSYSTPVLYSYYSKDGKDGETGITSRTAFAFTTTSSRDDAPNTPEGGYWDLVSNDVILPDGWYADPITDDINKYSWVSTALFTTAELKNPTWSKPACITGEDGVDGTDGLNSEFIYAILPNSSDLDTFKSYMTSKGISLEVSNTDTIPNFILNGSFRGTSLSIPRSDKSEFIVQLTDSPLGIDGESNKSEIYWTRTKSSTGWNNWIGPMFWSVWGENGMDGDGIEYIFTASNDSSCDTPLPTYADLLLNNPEEAKRFQEREYVPEGWFDNEENNDTNGNWKGCGPDAPYLFCSSRKQYVNVEGVQMWGDFTTPKIWGHYGMDGNGSYTSFAFCISKDDLSQYKVTGGRYTSALEGLSTYDASGKEIDFNWYDSIPRQPNFDETIWMINKFFNGSANETDAEWFGPSKMADSEYFQVEFNCPSENDSKSVYDGRALISLEAFKEMQSAKTPPIIYDSISDLENSWREYVYNNGYGLWTDGGKNAEYMATARFVNNKWEEWSVNKIKGETGDTSQFIFTLTDGSVPDNPTPANTDGDYQKDNYKPTGWSLEPLSVTEFEPVCWLAQRDRKSGTWNAYSTPVKWAMYAAGNVHIELSEDSITIPVEANGKIDSDYDDFIVVKISTYDNGTYISGNNIVYNAIINGSNDSEIDEVFTEKPGKSLINNAGFFGESLYIGRDFLSRWENDEKLRVECRVTYNGVPYVKSFTINKSTNAYEMELSQDVIYLDNKGNPKTNVIQVKVKKWKDTDFQLWASGYLDWEISYSDGKSSTYGNKLVEADAESAIDLSLYKNIKSVCINYRSESTSSEILTYEILGTVVDGKDGEGAITQFVSNVFCRTNADISSTAYAPNGGTYDNPVPDQSISVLIPDKFDRIKDVSNITTFWTDGIPKYNADTPKQIWMSSKIFYSDNSQSKEWSTPVLLQDTADTDIWWNDVDENNPGTPGNIDIGAVTSGNWYDGDSTNGNNITKNPIWMATRKQTNGSWSDWIITRVKGEKGEKGDSGADGGFGPMARYSVWGSKNAPETYYSREEASEAGSEWYDIVEYDGAYYLCNKSHSSSSSITPGTNGTVWIQSSHFDFLTANNGAIKDLVTDTIQANAVTTSKLYTSGEGAYIKIENGTMEVYGVKTDKHPDIKIGVEDGVAVLQFFDKDGVLLYDLGPTNGYRDLTKETVKEWVSASREAYVGLSSSPETYDRPEDIANEILELIKTSNWDWDSKLKDIYMYSCKTTINNETTYCEDHGIYSANKSVSNPLNGYYLYHHTERSYYDLSSSDFEEIQQWSEENWDVDIKEGNNFSPLKLHYCCVSYYIDGLPAGCGAANGKDLNDMYWLGN